MAHVEIWQEVREELNQDPVKEEIDKRIKFKALANREYQKWLLPHGRDDDISNLRARALKIDQDSNTFSSVTFAHGSTSG
jgi:hypothetical protein